MKKTIVLLSVAANLTVFAHDQLTTKLENTTAEQMKQEHIDVDNKFNLIAKQLAGLYVSDAFTNNETYTDCMNFISTKWNTLWNDSLSKVKPWAEEHISVMVNDTDTVFYPFGGPDIAYATQFFPHADKYVLLGLEPIGSFEHIESHRNEISTILALKTALSAYLNKGYFITSEMMTQLSNKDLRGCVYLILFELAKLNYTVTSVEDISIDNNGKEKARGQGELDSVKITCFKDGKKKTIYYMRINFLKSDKVESLEQFVSETKFVTFIKGASYALHDKNFGKIRQFILDCSQAVLQDDTGVPFYFYDSKWDKYPFGSYTQPTLPIFERYRQQTLSDFFASRIRVDIPFKIGYGYNQGRPNLLLAIPTHRKLQQQMQALANGHKTRCKCAKKETETASNSQPVTKTNVKIEVVRKNGSPAIAKPL